MQIVEVIDVKVRRRQFDVVSVGARNVRQKEVNASKKSAKENNEDEDYSTVGKR